MTCNDFSMDPSNLLKFKAFSVFLLGEIFSRAASSPLSLQSLARNSVRGRLREKSGGKSIRPLVERLRGQVTQVTLDIINYI